MASTAMEKLQPKEVIVVPDTPNYQKIAVRDQLASFRHPPAIALSAIPIKDQEKVKIKAMEKLQPKEVRVVPGTPCCQKIAVRDQLASFRHPPAIALSTIPIKDQGKVKIKAMEKLQPKEVIVVPDTPNYQKIAVRDQLASFRHPPAIALSAIPIKDQEKVKIKAMEKLQPKEVRVVPGTPSCQKIAVRDQLASFRHPPAIALSTIPIKDQGKVKIKENVTAVRHQVEAVELPVQTITISQRSMVDRQDQTINCENKNGEKAKSDVGRK